MNGRLVMAPELGYWVVEAAVVPVASSGEALGGVVMSEAIRETIKKIDEAVESLERVIELVKLKQMKLQIKLARLKAEARAKSTRCRWPPERSPNLRSLSFSSPAAERTSASGMGFS